MTITTARMRAIAFRRGSSLADPQCLVDVDVECPQPGPHDLRVAVRAVSVNPLDVKVRAGLVGVPDQVRSLGWDGAGIVDAVGEAVTAFKPGQAVYYAGSFDRSGSNAEFQLVDERIAGHMPTTLGFTDAAALPLAALTAWQLLFERLGVVRGQQAAAGSLLVLGGAGGVGSVLIQLARRLTNLTVVATASRAQSRDWCLAMGAHHVIDHRQSLPAQIAALPVPPVDHVAALSNTAEHLHELAELIAPQGRLAIIDDHDTLDAAPFKAKSVSLHWEMVFTRPLYATPDQIKQHRILNEVAALVDSGVLRSTATQVVQPMDAARMIQAHRLLEAGGITGKVVLARNEQDNTVHAPEAGQ